MFEKSKRLTYEQEQYQLFLQNLPRNIFDDGNEDYINYIIDLLRQEVKYSSLLEIYRGRKKNKFIYPFYKMIPEFINYSNCENINGNFIVQKKTIDINENTLISNPWHEKRYMAVLKEVKKRGFLYYSDNHMAIYYEGLNIACAYNGLHSLGIGTYFGKGKLEAEYYDVRQIFDSVEVSQSLAFRYNKEAVMRNLKNKGLSLDMFPKDEIEKCFYGTDYRLILIYYLCQQVYFQKKKDVIQKQPQHNFT